MIKREESIDSKQGGFWPTSEPFLFCVHHVDQYPEGTSQFGPDPKFLRDRQIGQDFIVKDGFRMYHGETVPGFPVHPHRGFETITIVRRGYVDHADSMGAIGRYGEGDVQWMTAGAGIQHSEMFPLLKKSESNPLELFQIWLNLPKKSKMVPADFKMFWSEKIPKLTQDSGLVKIELIAGRLSDKTALAPPPDSWAADADNEVSVLLVAIAPGGTFRFPPTAGAASRRIYFYSGSKIQVSDANAATSPASLEVGTAVEVESQKDLSVHVPASEISAAILFLQAKPIGEPVVKYGPFVMTTKEEVVQTIADYQATDFGGWRWERSDPIHGPDLHRFARFADGSVEKPSST